MKILLVSRANKKRKTEYLINKAFKELGHKVYVFNDKNAYSFIRGLTGWYFLHKVRKINPDLILYSKASKLPLEYIKKANALSKSAMWYFDADIPFKPSIVERAKLMDIFYLTNAGQLEELKEKGVKRAKFLPQAYGPHFDSIKVNEQPFRYEVAFIGNNKNEKNGFRENLLQTAAQKYRLDIWGKRWQNLSGKVSRHKKIYGKDYAKACARSKIMLALRGKNNQIGVEKYTSNRIWRTAGYGGFMLCQYAPGMDEFFKDRKHVVYFKTIDEALNLIGYYLENEDERITIRDQAMKMVRDNHTYRIRVKKILNDIEEVR